jgi:cation:H+ antiporter
MSIVWLVLMVITGLVLLKFGADWFVDGSAGLARRLHLSELAIGLTVVAFGTSAPELVVNIFAAANGNEQIVFGNIIGSNLFNLFVILSLAGLITPLAVSSSTAWKEIPFSFAALLAVLILANNMWIDRGNEMLGRIDGVILLVLFVLYLYYVFSQLKKDPAASDPVHTGPSPSRILVLMVAGLAGLVGGGKLVLEGAVDIARLLGISEKVIGLTIVAAGTSLPELATSVSAALKKSNDIAVGNIIGSNIFNFLFILPISALVRPMFFETSFTKDMLVLAAGTLVLIGAMYTGKKMQIDRWEALVLLVAYSLYLAMLLTSNQ